MMKPDLFSSVCIAAFVAIAAYLIFMVAFPPGRISEKARRVICAHALKAIGHAIREYAIDNGNALPHPNGVKGLQLLISPSTLPDSKSLCCPSDKLGVHYPLPPEFTSYVYCGAGLSLSSPGSTPVAFDKPGNHNGFGNVLFLDGSVKSFAGSNWMNDAGIRNEFQ